MLQYIGEKWTKEYVDGIKRLSTWLHGFLTIFPNRNLFRWIGITEEEFFKRVYKFGTEKGYRLIKDELSEIQKIV